MEKDIQPNLTNTNRQITEVPIKIAFTGHRDLDLTNYCAIRQELREKLLEIKANEPLPTADNTKNKFIVVFGNAIGADRIAMDVCSEIGLATNIIPSKGYKSKDYNIVADKIIKDAKYLVAMWDKTFNGKMGGTSDIVDRFNQNKNKIGYLRHKLESVKQNDLIKIIEVKRLPRKEENKIKIKNGFLLAGSIFSLFTIFDILSQTGLTTTFTSLETIFSLAKKSFYASIFPAIFFFIVWYLYKSVSNIKSLFLEFLFPLSIIVYTLITGIIGFNQLGFNLGDSFFGAANLLTLNSSIFGTYIDPKDYSNVGLWLVNARLFGGIFLAYAFFLAFSKATGRENIDRLKFRISRTFKKGKFTVVIGNSLKAYNLANHSSEQGQKVVFLYDGESEKIDHAMEEKNIYFMKGSSTSSLGLNKTFFQKAEKVYVLNNNDEDNFRTAQEMIEIQQEDKDVYPKGQWYVHLADVRQRDMLMSLKDNLPKVNQQCFDINQNIARRIVFNNESAALCSSDISTYQIVFFGFSALVEDLVLQYLRVGHFTEGKQLSIKIYFQKSDEANRISFEEKYPLFFKAAAGSFQNVVNYTFVRGTGQIIDFEPMPVSESGLINNSFSFYPLFTENSALYIYACMENGVKSAALLKTLLPRIANTQKSPFLKVFCYYNYLDPQEELNVQRSLCEKTMCQVPVTCFGNDLINCQTSEIDSEERDQLAKYFAYFYNQLYDIKYNSIKNDDEKFEKVIADFNFWHSINSLQIVDINFPVKIDNPWHPADIEKKWLAEPEMHKESNRQAADHSNVKRGLYNKIIPTQNQDLRNYWTETEVKNLSEVEHKRWNAEKLLLGWQPVDAANWDENSKNLKQQKFHHWLKEFNELTEIEKNKDRTQIKGLPYFLWEIEKLKNQ